jgi:hypothetical protein
LGLTIQIRDTHANLIVPYTLTHLKINKKMNIKNTKIVNGDPKNNTITIKQKKIKCGKKEKKITIRH